MALFKIVFKDQGGQYLARQNYMAALEERKFLLDAYIGQHLSEDFSVVKVEYRHENDMIDLSEPSDFEAMLEAYPEKVRRIVVTVKQKKSDSETLADTKSSEGPTTTSEGPTPASEGLTPASEEPTPTSGEISTASAGDSTVSETRSTGTRSKASGGAVKVPASPSPLAKGPSHTARGPSRTRKGSASGQSRDASTEPTWKSHRK
ncbi:hypothetical protein Bhyg_04010 [Pseudolycoriella hygida]|uniref:Uncharacterized protein n=1 Tax=Pseudolycoriella hygida TaxID=35572 RepID=A0A9Q0NEE0_9DIPT|nr:hypothetical protein Bhyg_04010 [Pseudolycoriella hygida]